VLPSGSLVLEAHLDAAMQVAHDLQTLANDVGVELDFREDRRIRTEEDRRARAARGALLLERTLRLALAETHLPLLAVAPHGGRQLARQRIDDARADTVQAAGRLVVAGLELSAGMEHGEDHLERALLRSGVRIHRNAAAIVVDG